MNFLEHPFGMTGSLMYYEDALEEPTHARVLIYFGSGYHLDFDNQRLFGKVDLIQDPDGFIWEHEFGLDPRWIPRPGAGEEITIEVTGLPHGTSLSSSVCRWSIDTRTTFITQKSVPGGALIIGAAVVVSRRSGA